MFIQLRKQFNRLLVQAIGAVCRKSEKKFLLASLGRSGGTTLLNLLNAHPQVDIFDEPFEDGVTKRPFLLLEGFASKAGLQGKVWGGKIKPWQLSRAQIDPACFFEEAHKTGWVLLHLRRLNLAKQVIARSARFAANGEEFYQKGMNMRIELNPDLVKRNFEWAEDITSNHNSLLKTLPFHEIIYETDVLPIENRQRTCDKIFQLLGLESVSTSHIAVHTESDDISDIVSNSNTIEKVLSELGYSYCDSDYL